MATVINFKEQKNTVLFHDIKVFLYGQDVSPYIEGAVSINYANRDGFNSTSFSLTNALQQFEITPDNINDPTGKKGGWRLTGATRYSEQAKFNIYQKKNNLKVNPHADLQALLSTSSGGNALRGTGQASTSVGKPKQTRRWPLGPYQLIFNKMDQVRIFIHNPYSEADQWVWAFSGFLDTKTFDTNYVNGQSTIKIVAQDIRNLMKKMRVSLNPYIATTTMVEKAFTKGGGTSFFNDLILTTQNPSAPPLSHPFANTGFVDAMTTLICGKVAKGSGSNKTVSSVGNMMGASSRPGSTAVGSMGLGQYITYDYTSSSSKSTLDTWNALCIFGGEGGWMTEARVNEIGNGSYEGGPYDITGTKVHFLVPKSGTPVNSLIEVNVDSAQNANLEWTSRYDLILQIAKNIDYEFTVAANGDILFEFPMYDFFPWSFNSSWQNVYTVDWHAEKDDINDEGGEAVAALAANSGRLEKYLAADPVNVGAAPVQTTSERRVVIFSDVLASRVGALTETFTLPGITSRGRLEQLALIEFMKRNADFSTFSMDFTYRPWIRPNRPVYHKTKERLGIASSFTLGITIHGECTSQATMRFARSKEQDQSFRFITGDEAAPISYSSIYNPPADTTASDNRDSK